jgi:CRISPR-associated protein Cmr4
MSTHLVLIQALSPIHCGTGQAISGIDLPIAREKPTGIPLIPGSSIKGVLRAQPGGYDAAAEGKSEAKERHILAFGPDTDKASEHAGAVQFGDAHLLFLPVRSVRGTFAWVTSPYLLKRFARDAKECNLTWSPTSITEVIDKKALVTGKCLKVRVQTQEKVVFEDFDFEAQNSEQLTTFAKAFGASLFGEKEAADIKHFVDRVCVVSDDVMRVLSRVGMEVVARNRISNETKTVEKGALWTEEALPVESILSGLLVANAIKVTHPTRKEATKEATAEQLVEHVKSLCEGAIQLGGKATIGRGVCKMEVL